MANRVWRIVSGVGLVSSLAAWPLGVDVQSTLMVCSCLVCLICVFVGMAKWRPPKRSPWIYFAASTSTLVLTSILKVGEIGSSLTPLPASDVVAAIGYALFIAGAHQLGRLRDHGQDPTNLVDALVQTAAVGVLVWAVFLLPYMENDSATSGGKAAAVLFSFLDLGIFFSIARLAIGPGARTPSYYLFAITAAGILLSDLTIDASQASMKFWGASEFPIMLPTLSFIAGGSAALHPLMAELTKAGRVDVGRVSRFRLSLTALAIVIPPVVVVLQYAASGNAIFLVALGPCCIVISLMVMSRFAGMARAREKIADLERSSARAAACLAAAQNSELLKSAIVSAIAEFMGGVSSAAVVSLAFLDGEVWRPSVEWVGGESRVWNSPPTLTVRTALDELISDKNRSIAPNVVELADSKLVVVPLSSKGRVTGAVVIETRSDVSSSLLHTVETLATQSAIALDAALLSEDLLKRKSDRRFRALVEHSSDLIVVLGDEQSITFSSPAADRLLGGRKGDVRALLATVHPEDQLALLTLIENTRPDARGLRVECRLIDPNDEVQWFEISASDMRGDGEINGIVINAHDITGRKLLEENLRHRVLHDDLTGIANRALFRDRLEHSLRGRDDKAAGLAVLFIDLDDFKTVNDGLGHGVGDELLKVIALRLQNFLREEDTAARFGGDEFAILLHNLTDQQHAVDVADRLIEVIREPIEFSEEEVSVNASVGIAMAAPSSDAEVMLRNADVAMYHAKRGGKGRVQTFSETMFKQAMERLEIKRDLIHVIERDELMLYFQPLVSLETGVTLGFEALLRWNHPVRGFVSPDSFIPVAEDTGFIKQIGLWVLEHGIAALAEMDANGNEGLTMSVNVSPLQLDSDDVLLQLATSLEKHSILPQRIILELTETSALGSDASRERLAALATLGVGIAADDFGSGFASYASLQQLPFTTVKIDRSLIMGIADADSMGEVQVRSIVEMAHASGLSVVAEGIEEEAQREILASMSCDKGQGYLFSRPIALLEALTWLAENRAISVG